MEFQTHELHARLQPQAPSLAAFDRGGPLSRPADGRNHAAAVPLQIEEGADVGRPAAGGGKVDPLAGIESLVEGEKVIHLVLASVDTVQDHVGRRLGERHCHVQGAKLLDEGRILVAAIGEVQRPIDGRRVGVDGHYGLDFQPGVGIVERYRALGFRGVDGLLLDRAFPLADQFGQSAAAVDEGKGQLLRSGPAAMKGRLVERFRGRSERDASGGKENARQDEKTRRGQESSRHDHLQVG